jgi:hypothetical protein
MNTEAKISTGVDSMRSAPINILGNIGTFMILCSKRFFGTTMYQTSKNGVGVEDSFLRLFRQQNKCMKNYHQKKFSIHPPPKGPCAGGFLEKNLKLSEPQCASK